MVTGVAEVGVNVTLQVLPLSSMHEFVLNEPDPPVEVRDTVPVGDEPVTETVTVVGLLTLTDDGERVTLVDAVVIPLVRVAPLELGALIKSPP